jgi:subtilisin family serine protease
MPGTTENVITVGSYTTRSSGTGSVVNRITGFSSKGPLTNGKIKPDITAPGDELISSVNSFDAMMDIFIQIGMYEVADETQNGQHKFVGLSGTSMSAPMVAGIVALMLEKKPNLTHTEAKEIIRITAFNDQYTDNAKDNKSPV